MQLIAGETSISMSRLVVSPKPWEKPPEPPENPSGPSFIDRNLKAGKFVLKEGVREAIVESIKGLLGLKSQPDQAPQV